MIYNVIKMFEVKMLFLKNIFFNLKPPYFSLMMPEAGFEPFVSGLRVNYSTTVLPPLEMVLDQII